MSNKIQLIGQAHREREALKNEFQRSDTFLQRLDRDTVLLELMARQHRAEKLVYGNRIRQWWVKKLHGRDLRAEYEKLKRSKPELLRIQDEVKMFEILARRKYALRSLAGGRMMEFIMVKILGRDPYVNPFLNIRITRNDKSTEDNVSRGPGSKEDSAQP